MTETQAKRLLRFHLTGDPGGGKWETMKALLDKGYVEEQSKRLVLTSKGKAWCDENHLKY